MDEVATEAYTTTTLPLPVVRATIIKVSNGYLVETKDKHYNGSESVHLDLDGALEAVHTAF